jgi:hypothetical protein
MKPEDQIWKDWDELEDALGGDALQFEDAVTDRDSPRLRRAYCRAVFAYAEGIAGWMKRYTILHYYPGIMGDKERRELEHRDGALESIYRAFDLFTDTAGARTPLEKDSKEWTALRSAIAIRNRVTHPAKANDVIISDSDFADLCAVRRLITDLVRQSLKRSATELLRKERATRILWEKMIKTPNQAL